MNPIDAPLQTRSSGWAVVTLPEAVLFLLDKGVIQSNDDEWPELEERLGNKHPIQLNVTMIKLKTE